MPGIDGQGTTFNLPNYTGELFNITPTDTPLLSAIGGMYGGKAVTSTEFEWQYFDLRDAAQNVKKEGATAGDGEARVRKNVTNVVQIHQEVIEVSYTKQAAYGLKGMTGALASPNDLPNPVRDEMSWQQEQMMKQIARDVEFSFINGVYAKPADNTAPRKTKGLLAAITTNKITAPATTPGTTDLLTLEMLNELAKKCYDSGGLMETDTRTIICGSSQKRNISMLLANAYGKYIELDRNVGGVNFKTINTDFGVFNIMLDRHMPQTEIALVSLEQLKPVFLEIPGKGHFFTEPLAKTSSAERIQIYGEIGLEWGNERAHGKITGLSEKPPKAPGA